MVVLVIFGTIAIASFVSLKNKTAFVPYVPLTHTTSNKVATSSNVIKSPTKLLTYRNEEIGFEFSYPDDATPIMDDKEFPDKDTINKTLLLHFILGRSFGDVE